MTRVFKPASADEHKAFVVSHCDRCLGCLGKACDILDAVIVNHETDPDYPAEWIRDDDGMPTCTAFAPRDTVGETAPAVDQGHGASVPEPVAARAAEPEELPVDLVQATLIGKGLIEVGRLKGKRIWSLPYAAVADLFESEDALALRAALGVPAPATARVHRARTHMTITARSTHGAASVSSSVRIRFRRSA